MGSGQVTNKGLRRNEDELRAWIVFSFWCSEFGEEGLLKLKKKKKLSIILIHLFISYIYLDYKIKYL